MSAGADQTITFTAETAEALGQQATEAAALASLAPQVALSDGELVLLWLKPSLLFIPLASLGSIFFIAFIVVALAYLSRLDLAFVNWTEVQAAIFGLAAVSVRIGWQALDWSSRTFILTDRRILTMQGVVRRQVAQAPLRNIRHVAMVQSLRERLTLVGTLAFATAESGRFETEWLMLHRPRDVRRRVLEAIDRYAGRHK